MPFNNKVVRRLYLKDKQTNTIKELLTLKDVNGNLIHKRVDLSYYNYIPRPGLPDPVLLERHKETWKLNVEHIPSVPAPPEGESVNFLGFTDNLVTEELVNFNTYIVPKINQDFYAIWTKNIISEFKALLENLITANVDTGLNINVIDQSEISINLKATQYEELNYLLNLNNLVDASSNIGLNLVIHEDSVISLDYNYRSYREKDYLLSLNTNEVANVVSGLNINELYNQLIGLNYSGKGYQNNQIDLTLDSLENATVLLGQTINEVYNQLIGLDYRGYQEKDYLLSLTTEEITTRAIGHNISVEEESAIGIGSYKTIQENIYILELNTEEITTRTAGHNISVEETSVIGVDNYNVQKQTSNPVIEVRYTGLFNAMEYRIKNTDNAPAIIYADTSYNPPTINRGLVQPNEWTSWISGGCQQNFCQLTIRAMAEASGKTLSEVVSRYAD